jgi:hypothetical protein
MNAALAASVTSKIEEKSFERHVSLDVEVHVVVKHCSLYNKAV